MPSRILSPAAVEATNTNAMDSSAESSLPLERSVSGHSSASLSVRRSRRSDSRSRSRSTTVRARSKRFPSHVSSSGSSIAASDKSLTSFPSFSPESPKPIRTMLSSDNGSDTVTDDDDNDDDDDSFRHRTDSANDPTTLTLTARSALFEDVPVSTHKIPGALHMADDQHIQRLIARHGAVELVRLVAADLAQRDAQIATLRRKADDRDRALRKVILQCGLSNLELETRLRAIESEARANRPANARAETGLSDLMNDAMQDTYHTFAHTGLDSTIRASKASSLSLDSDNNTKSSTGNNTTKGTFRGWKDFLWGGSTAKRGSSTSSVNGGGGGGGGDRRSATVVRAGSHADRRPGLQEDLFDPPDSRSVASQSGASGASSIQSGLTENNRKSSSSSMAVGLMRLVVGGAMATREADGGRGRSASAAQAQAQAQATSQTMRSSSSASIRTTQSSRAASVQGGPKALMALRRGAGTPTPIAPPAARSQAWETMASSPPSLSGSGRQESYGPVEMDAIHPPESQPPTLSHVYNNNNVHANSECLTDRFGFIYDQRRKRRQREAAHFVRDSKKNSKSRAEMLSNGRSGISPPMLEEDLSPASETRPDSPVSAAEEQRPEEERPRRWQDYLKLATFPTELLSHTPALSGPSLEVLESSDAMDSYKAAADGGAVERARSPGLITTDERGFVPIASTTASTTTTSVADFDDATVPDEDEPTTAAATHREDAEPVRLLLQHMNELHDSLQRERTIRWNEFLRKVRAERKRDGEAAAAAALAAAEARYERPSVILPEAIMADGELIGITGLGVKGKVGRAKRNELRSLVLGGIPVAYRAKVWSECSGATSLRVPGYYQDLVAQAGRGEGDDDPSVVSQIQMDIRRTLTDNIFFRKGPGVGKLNEVLLAYARRNAEVGYCQGMNMIAANLLLVMPTAEDAFWVLASFVERILPAGYYDHSLRASRADQQVLRRYVAEVLPRLSAHLEALAVDLEALTFQWFLSVFTDCLGAEALFRVWDVVLCADEGSTFLFQVALALLKLNEAALLGQCHTSAAVYTYIGHQVTNHAISIDNMIKASDGLRRVVRRDDVEARREEAMRAEEEAVREREEALAARKAAASAAGE
ncbi:TBC-domain-containing protein [Sodiomyces alkalinus F11]|uniref:TBC-domain-containing protein n=1 Tax=Sodiomyces alkalinus (strain CBS 110278 / VKM F-3762 / F11) TaxID=1314773 RepID=A0A3N2PKK8_SODAK|nr:TBC-domain-containing protein [Sodiomyces alkalinus F11]ROT35047.1 TBC-domain-containing protein [Sodiomyces alkalinus F11]